MFRLRTSRKILNQSEEEKEREKENEKENKTKKSMIYVEYIN